VSDETDEITCAKCGIWLTVPDGVPEDRLWVRETWVGEFKRIEVAK